MAITHAAKVESEQHGDRLPRVEMALDALRNVIKYNPGMWLYPWQIRQIEEP